MSAVSASLDVVVLASGRGSNLRSILAACAAGTCSARVVAVVSDKPDAPALALAAEHRIATVVVALNGKSDRAAWDERLAAAVAHCFEPHDAQRLVVLAGFMRIVGPAMLARFPHCMVNVHPALLPSFPGLDAIGQAVDHGVKVTGVTVHFVDEGTDTGPAILQRAVQVPPDGGREALEEAIHAVEHEIYPEAIGMIARGRVKIAADNPRLVIVDGAGQTD